MYSIKQKGHKVLNQKAQEVKKSELNSEKIYKIIEAMKEMVQKEDDGVAIAAPQIGEPYRIFVLSDLAFSKSQKNRDYVYINPKIIKQSKDKSFMMEGCLSVRWIYGEVLRANKVVISYIDEYGNEKTKGGSGLMAQIFQHEIDHLNGILFDSKAINQEDMPPEKVAKLKEESKIKEIKYNPLDV